MFLDKIITVVVIILLNFILFRKYINGYSKFNLFAMLASVASLSIYLYAILKSMVLKWYVQVIIILFMCVIPCIVYFTVNKDSEVSRKNIYGKIKKYIDEKKTEEAKKIIAKYLEDNEEDSKICIFSGLCSKIEGDYENAISKFMKAVELDKRSYVAYYELGSILEEQNNIDSAIVMLTNAIKIKPDFYDASELLGICYTSKREYNDAENVYLNALKYHKDSYELNYNMAIINLEKGYIDNAEDYLVKASNLSSRPYGACYSLGNIYYKKSKYQNSLENYKVSRLSEDFSASSYYKMAIIYSKMREYENAEVCLKYSILLDKKYLNKSKSELYFDKIIPNIQKFEQDLDIIINKYGDELFSKVMEIASTSDFLNPENINMI